MFALPDWMYHPISAEDYEAMPEEICRQIEIIDGKVYVCPRPSRDHQGVVGDLVGPLDEAAGPEFAATFRVDLRLRDVPLLNRVPDVVVYDASLPNEVMLRPEHCLLVVEVMCPGSVTTDQIDKPAEYAAAGIEHFWRFELEARTLYRYRLDGGMALVGKDTGLVTIAEPVALTLDLDALG